MKELSKSEIYSNLVIYSVAHFMVDAACIAVTYCGAVANSVDKRGMFMLIIVYNLLAFGFQPLFGIEIDRRRSPKAAAMFGAILTALAVLLAGIMPVFAVILAGIGNAIFHLGGGSICLALDPGKAAFPGMFVAPGAFGVYIGTLSGRMIGFPLYIFSLGLIVLLTAMYFTTPPDYDYQRPLSIKKLSAFWSVIALMLFVVAMRSLLGLCANFPWKSEPSLLFVLTIAVVGGKALGGILADRFGWRFVAFASLLISAPLMSLCADVPVLAITGAFLFNMTMPITLAAVACVLRNSPAFGFGLTCLALFIGSVPAFTGFRVCLSSGFAPFTLTVAAAAAAFIGLSIYKKHYEI